MITFFSKYFLCFWIILILLLRVYISHLEPLYNRYLLPIASDFFLTPQLPSEEYFSFDGNNKYPNDLFTNTFGSVVILATFIVDF